MRIAWVTVWVTATPSWLLVPRFDSSKTMKEAMSSPIEDFVRFRELNEGCVFLAMAPEPRWWRMAWVTVTTS